MQIQTVSGQKVRQNHRLFPRFYYRDKPCVLQLFYYFLINICNSTINIITRSYPQTIRCQMLRICVLGFTHVALIYKHLRYALYSIRSQCIWAVRARFFSKRNKYSKNLVIKKYMFALQNLTCPQQSSTSSASMQFRQFLSNVFRAFLDVGFWCLQSMVINVPRDSLFIVRIPYRTFLEVFFWCLCTLAPKIIAL